MLQYNFERIFKARGIERPYSFLLRSGFGTSLATRIGKNQVKFITLPSIEKLCLVFHCTPNDLLEWIPDSNTDTDKDEPLNDLLKTEEKITDLTRSLHSLPLNKLEEIGKYIEGQVNEKAGA